MHVFFNTRIYAYIRWRYVKVNTPQRNGFKKNLDRKEVLFFIMAGKCANVSRAQDVMLRPCKLIGCLIGQIFFSPCLCVKTTFGSASFAACQFEPRGAWLARKPCCTSREQAIANQDREKRIQAPLSALGLGKHRVSERTSRRTWSCRVVLYVSKWGVDTESVFLTFYLSILFEDPHKMPL